MPSGVGVQVPPSAPTCNPEHKLVLCSKSVDAGWSSLVARRAHNPKVVGSNPAPATNLLKMQTLKAAWNIKLKVFCTLMRDGAVW